MRERCTPIPSWYARGHYWSFSYKIVKCILIFHPKSWPPNRVFSNSAVTKSAIKLDVDKLRHVFLKFEMKRIGSSQEVRVLMNVNMKQNLVMRSYYSWLSVPHGLKDALQSVMHSPSPLIFINISLNRWNANQCYSPLTISLIFEVDFPISFIDFHTCEVVSSSALRKNKA